MYGMTRHKILREMEGEYGQREFCILEVELRINRDDLPCLSICGTHGYVITERQARKEALQNWEQFFDDSPNELAAMNERCNTRFRSSKSAAKYVVATDGEYHGLDVVYAPSGDPDMVYVCTSCGQIREEIAKFFPEVVPMFKYHLNDMVNHEGEYLYRPLSKDAKAFAADPEKWIAEHPIVAQAIADSLLVECNN